MGLKLFEGCFYEKPIWFRVNSTPSLAIISRKFFPERFGKLANSFSSGAFRTNHKGLLVIIGVVKRRAVKWRGREELVSLNLPDHRGRLFGEQ